jgi:hypothetical protein
MQSGNITGGKVGYVLSQNSNASIIAVNKLLADGSEVYRISNGDFFIKTKDKNQLSSLAKSYSVSFSGTSKDLSKGSIKLSLPKVGIYKSWRANMDEGWTRWVLEKYEFPLDTLHNQDIINGDLNQYSAIIIPSQSGSGILHGYTDNTYPDEYSGGIGLNGTLALKQYAEKGGRIIALDESSDFLIEQFGLPIRNVVKNTPSTSFFIPGSLVKINVETGNALTFGMQKESVAYFVRSRAFDIVKLRETGEGGKETLKKRPPNQPVKVLARYAKKDILLSGWAMGEEKNIGGKIAMAEVKTGDGSVVLVGFRPRFRAQPRNTFKLLFNALY